MCEVPVHLNKECFEKAIEKCVNTKVELLNWSLKLANIDGGNFCSNVYRLNGYYRTLENEAFDGEVKNFKFFIKDTIKSIENNDTNEMIMLSKILPEIENIFKTASLHKNKENYEKLSACCYFSEKNSDFEFYIMEDLAEAGYVLGNRYDGLDEEQIKLVLEKLAKFHAASMVFVEKFADILVSLQKPDSSSSDDSIGQSITGCGMLYVVKMLEDLGEETVEKMHRLIVEYDERVKKIEDTEKSEFNVLNHGDLWVNNILFQKDRKKPDAVFVDFQNLFWGSPGNDLQYFLSTSVPLNILQTRRFELIHHYYKFLKFTLENCGYSKIPTWESLRKEFRRCSLIGYNSTLCELPIVCMSDAISKGFTSKTFTDPNVMPAKRKLMYENKRVRESIWYGVQHYEEIGLLDENIS